MIKINNIENILYIKTILAGTDYNEKLDMLESLHEYDIDILQECFDEINHIFLYDKEACLKRAALQSIVLLGNLHTYS